MENFYYLRKGDCFELIEELPDKSISLVVTDPPYQLSQITNGGTINDKGHFRNFLLSAKNDTPELFNSYDIRRIKDQIKRISRDGINAYFFCNKAQIPEYIQLYVNDEKCKFEILCWHKTNTVSTYSNKYLTDTEYILWFHSGKGHCKPKSYNDAHTFFVQPMNVTDKKRWGHPTIKPINIIKTLIRNSSACGDVVLDPFMGSGTTGVAALEERRRFIGFEKNEKWFKMATNRIEESIRRCACDTSPFISNKVSNQPNNP